MDAVLQQLQSQPNIAAPQAVGDPILQQLSQVHPKITYTVNPDDFLPSYLPKDIGAALVGAGHTADKLVSGVKHLYYKATGNDQALQDLQTQQASQDAAYAPLSDAHPIDTAIGGAAPYFAIPGGMLAGNAGKALMTAGLTRAGAKVATSGLADTMLAGAALGGASYPAEGESRARNALLNAAGGGLGYGAARVIGKAVSPALNKLGDTLSPIADQAKSLGAQLTPGQRLASPALQKLESSMDSFPPTANVLGNIKTGNQEALNKAVANSIGQDATNVSSQTLDAAQKSISDVYNKVATDARVPLHENQSQLLGKLADINNEYSGMLQKPLAENPLVQMTLDHINSGTATQKELQTLSSKLGNRAASEMRTPSGDRQLGMALYDIKNIVDDSLQNNLSGGLKQEFKQAREQYRNLMMILSNTGIVNESNGNVSGKMLANALARKDRAGFTYGRNNSDMYTMAHFAEAFPQAVGDSGTATRNFLPWMLGMMGSGAGAGAAVGHPLVGGLGGLMAPPIANVLARGYVSKPVQAYLGNTVIPEATQKALASKVGRGTAGLLSSNQNLLK